MKVLQMKMQRYWQRLSKLTTQCNYLCILSKLDTLYYIGKLKNIFYLP